MGKRKHEETHPWLSFSVDLRHAPTDLWVMLGECQSKIEHLAGVPLRPDTAKELYRLYLARGARATTAIEGNTLSEEEVLKQIEGTLRLPPSREYLQQEVKNILDACTQISQEAIRADSAGCDPARIKEFNRAVLANLSLPEGVTPGKVTIPVGVGSYRGAPREDCEYLLDKLCAWLNGSDFGPRGELQAGMGVVKAVLAHLYLAWIHPFGDGNGRTARLMEFDILLRAGVPAPAAHLLSNHYNLTREEYYRQLDRASRSGGDVVPFLCYAVQGFRDGLREQVDSVRKQQRSVAWENYVHEVFQGKSTAASQRQRTLVLALTEHNAPVRRSGLTSISPGVASDYARKGGKTLTRDLHVLEKLELIKLETIRTKDGVMYGGYSANTGMIDAFLLPRRGQSVQA